LKVSVVIEGDKELVAMMAKIGERVSGAVLQATQLGANVGVNAAKRRAPGPYIEMKVEKSTTRLAEVTIGPDKEHWYYQFFETGASGHEIDGNVKRALRFTMGSEEVVVKRVKHPGMAAEPFLRPALDENQAQIQEAMASEFRRVIESLSSG
jgi:HK97 gp10 family phage protein